MFCLFLVINVDKKGMEFYFVVTMILLIVGAIVLVMFQQKIFGTLGEKGSELGCKTSIAVAAKSKAGIPLIKKAGTPLVRLDCPRGNITMKKEDVVDGNKINQDKAHRIIADSMWSCWDKAGRGKLDPFSNWETEGISYCLICDTIDFDEDLKEFMNSAKTEQEAIDRTIHNPLPYLLTNYHPKFENKTYYEMIYNVPRGYKEYPSKENLTLLETNAPKSLVLPGSMTLLQAHKLEARSSIAAYAGYGFVIVGLVGATMATGGLLLVLTPIAVTTSVGLAALGVGAAGVLIGGVGATSIYSITGLPWTDCRDCDIAGGIQLVPFDDSLSKEIEIGEGENKYTARLCDIIVN